MFLLVKWYCDVVTDQGSGVILYAARLRWGPVRMGYAATLFFPGGTAVREKATYRGVELPHFEGDVVTWRSERLGTLGRWCREVPPIERCLAQGPHGSIEWKCHMPRARGAVQIGDACLDGLGYVECLRLSIPPSRLPFRQLRWGRHVSPQRWLVWIDWAGGDEKRWVWLDGLDQPAAVVSDHGVQDLSEGRQLVLEEGRDLRDRPVLATIGVPWPALTRRLAGPLGRMHEQKRLARSSIVRAGEPIDHGWTVYEEVVW